MRRIIILTLVLATISVYCQDSKKNDLETTKWEGFIKAGKTELKLILKLEVEKCLLEVPAQALMDYPSTKYKVTKDSLFISFSGMLQADFVGKKQADTLITGSWIQSSISYPISLKKKKEYIRPQNPQQPFPYKVENVTYFNKDKSIKFGGTLTTPEKGDKFPVAILITGSGQEDRDETLFGHKPFLIIADYLTRNGIAVLRVDDRGIGETTGKETLSNATSYDFAKDVSAGIEFLKERKEIDPMKIGLIGHSEGGMIASIIGAERKDIAFIVSMAGVGVSGYVILLSQIETRLKKNEIPKQSIDSILAIEKKTLEIFRKEPDNRLAGKMIQKQLSLGLLMKQDSLTQKYFMVTQKDGFTTLNMDELGKRYISRMSPWNRYSMSYSPDSVLNKINTPFLAINGEKDTQVLAKLNLNGFESIFKKYGKKDYKIISYPGLNHFFQHCNTGYMDEVETIEETMSNDVLNDMTNWIKEQIRKK